MQVKLPRSEEPILYVAGGPSLIVKEFELEHYMKKLKTLYNQLGPNIIGSIDAAVDVISPWLPTRKSQDPNEATSSRSICASKSV